MTRVNLPRLASHVRSPVVAFLLVFALALAFGLLAAQALTGGTVVFDRWILSWFRGSGTVADPIGPAWAEEMGRDITALGSTIVLGLVLAAATSYLLLIRKRAAAILLTAALVGGWVLSTALKVSIGRARPDLPHAARVFTASFPSQHATLSIITVLVIGALLGRADADRRVKVFFVALGLFLTWIIGVSRVYLGLHYASDVVAGWLVGLAWVILCWQGALHLQRVGQIAPDALSFRA